MKLGLRHKKVLITGAGRGLGRAMALALANEGAKVAVVSRTEADLKKLYARMGGARSGHFWAVCDLTQAGAPAGIVAHTRKKLGGIDILVNNLGGTLDVRNPFCSLDDWRRVYRLNLEVAIELGNLVVPAMKKKRWGRIVNIASTASLENNGPVTYCTMKAALVSYTRCIGRILAPDGVVVSAILPGAVVTEGGHWERAQKERPEHVRKYLAERCPLGRFGTPQEIAGMVAFLCSEQASFCQGAIVPVDGGQSRHYFL